MFREVRELPIEPDADGKFSDEDVAFVCHLERILIEALGTRTNVNGANMTSGGEMISGYTHTEEVRARLSAARQGMYQGQKNPMYGKRGTGSPNYGRHLSAEHKRAISDANKGRVFTAEHRERIGAHSSKRTGSANPFFGRKHSKETLARIKLTKTINQLRKKRPELTREQVEEMARDYLVTNDYAKSSQAILDQSTSDKQST